MLRCLRKKEEEEGRKGSREGEVEGRRDLEGRGERENSLFFFSFLTSATAALPRGPYWKTQSLGCSKEKKKKSRPRAAAVAAAAAAPRAHEAEVVEVEVDSAKAAAAARKSMMMLAALLSNPFPPVACPPRSCCSLRSPGRLAQRVVAASPESSGSRRAWPALGRARGECGDGGGGDGEAAASKSRAIALSLFDRCFPPLSECLFVPSTPRGVSTSTQ